MRKPPLQDVIVKSSDRVCRSAYRATDVENVPSGDRMQYQTRTVPPTTRRHVDEYERDEESVKNRFPPHEYDEYNRKDTRKNKGWFYIALGVGTVVICTSIILSLLFAGATITVHPKQDTVVVNAQFDTHTSTSGSEGVVFERITLERTAKRAVVAQGEEEVEERASGKIIIYNEFSETPQRLIKNTRFQSEDKRIYRIYESIEIPGKKTNGDPGTIEVIVHAEEPGNEYNITGEKTLSIPGFEGMPQATKIYAKTLGDIQGGFKGIKMVINEEDRIKAVEEIEAQLRDELLSAAFSSQDKPEGYNLFKEAVFFEFNALPDEYGEGSEVTLTLSGKLHGVLFEKDTFSKYVAKTTLSSYTDSPIRIDNLEELSVSITPFGHEEGENNSEEGDGVEKVDKNVPWQSSAYSVSVQGKAKFIWEFDEKTLISYVSGKKIEEVDPALDNGLQEMCPGIDRIEVSVRPFWKNTFPDGSDKIVVITKLDD